MSNSEKKRAEESRRRKRLLALIAEILLWEGLITPGEQLKILELLKKE